ncbi:hypothetical protein F4776DRAFT_518588 [Hypoxylon sp. NC0597]|nr:hypothetical protein F4776DRAFT_518588 [Hypoxylon sp. NC0597]
MAEQSKDSSSETSSGTSNGDITPTTSTNGSLFETHVAELDNDGDEDDPNDPELLDPQSPADEGYREGDHDFRFKRLDELIKSHTAAAAATIKPEKPYNDCPSRELHNSNQRAIWRRIREEAANDHDIPNALFSPPRTYIEVRVSEWPRLGHYCCPCDINPDACEAIEIRAPGDSEDGITKDMFIQRVSEAFYGRDPGDNKEGDGDGYKIGGEEDRPVIDHFDYMIQGGGNGRVKIMGHIFAMTRGITP